jgi:hypothetical protein
MLKVIEYKANWCRIDDLPNADCNNGKDEGIYPLAAAAWILGFRVKLM